MRCDKNKIKTQTKIAAVAACILSLNLTKNFIQPIVTKSLHVFSHKILVNIYVSMYAYESTTKELQQQNLTFNNQQSFVRWDCSSN